MRIMRFLGKRSALVRRFFGALGFSSSGADVSPLVSGIGSGFPQEDLVHFELELGGVELLGAGSEEALLEGGDDLILAGEFGFEKGVLRLQTDDLFLKLTEALEEGFEIFRSAFIH
jgi:hypothetical protein